MNQPVHVDLHVHSAYSSDGDTSWLQFLKLSECRTSPRRAYDLALRRGMDYVTITDHDTINGCLEIAHLDRFFISEEITAVFPEDGAKFHVLAFGISEAQHAMIASLRTNIYELTAFLNAENIPHAVAHPFYRMGPPLGLEHFEKLLLLFKTFEIRNGGKQVFPETLLEDVFSRLSAEQIWRLADKHDLAPCGAEPWKKAGIAGSDDHGGILIGYPHTEIEEAGTTDALLDHLRAGGCRPSGPGGTPLAVAHGIMAVAFNNLRKDPAPLKDIQGHLVWNALGQLFDNANPGRKPSFLLGILLMLARKLEFPESGKGIKSRNPVQKPFMRLLREFPPAGEWLRNGLDFSPENSDRLFRMLADWAHGIMADLFSRRSLKLPEDLTELWPGLLSAAVYGIALKTEYQDRPLIRAVRKRFVDADPAGIHSVLVFTDGPSREVVESLVCKYLNRDPRRSGPMHVFGLNADQSHRGNRFDFKPLGSVKTEAGEVQVPPLLDVIDRMMSIDTETVFVRTFGPMGVLGILLGKWIGCRTICVLPARPVEQGQDADPDSSLQLNGLTGILLRFSDRILVPRPSDMAFISNLGVPLDRIFIMKTDHAPSRGDHECRLIGEPDPEFDPAGMTFYD